MGGHPIARPELLFSLPIDTIFFVILQTYIIGL